MSDNRLREERYEVRLLKEEMDIFKRKSELAGKDRAEYFRDFLLFGNPIVRDILNDIDADRIIFELNRIGNNINQIAYHSNMKCEVSMNDFQSLKESYDNLLELYVNQIVNRIGKKGE